MKLQVNIVTVLLLTQLWLAAGFVCPSDAMADPTAGETTPKRIGTVVSIAAVRPQIPSRSPQPLFVLTNSVDSRGQSPEFHCLSFWDHDKVLLSGESHPNVIKCWNLSTKAVDRVLGGFSGPVRRILVSADYQYLIGVCSSLAIFFKAYDGWILRSMVPTGGLTFSWCAYSPDASVFAANMSPTTDSFERGKFGLNHRPESIWKSLNVDRGDCEFSPDGSLLAIAGYQDVTLCSTKSFRVAKTIRHVHGSLPTFSADGAHFALDCGFAVRLYDVKTWKPLKVVAFEQTNVVGLSFGNGGRSLVRVSSGRGWPSVVDVVDLTTGKTVSHWAETGWVTSMAVSRDGSLLAVAVEDTIKIYRLNDDVGL